MMHTVLTWLLVAGFLIAGLVNAIGTAGTQSGFVKWGFPHWWGRVTGGLEILSAVLMMFSASRFVGVALGAIILAAAVITVLRHRDYSHLLVIPAKAEALQ